ncbi:MAG: sensor domain-containing diguanylate cyclase, partial [Dehalococcoidia bacterium]|nr:sensor domain-containing diguanylate cyclase [Dehalococcoidia bacterium]
MKILSELARLANGALQPEEAVEQALPLLEAGLDAREVFLVYGDAGGFRSFGSRADLELSDVALWLVHRDLTSRGGPSAFELRDGRVDGYRDVTDGGPCEYLAALTPIAGGAGEMLVARGCWEEGLGPERAGFLTAALPGVTLLLDRRLDSSRAQRQHNQLSALANITRVMSESEDIEAVLTSIASTITLVADVDNVSIDLVDTKGKVTVRCVSSTRPEVDAFRERWKRGASRPDPIRDAVIRTRRPVLLPDAQNDERIPEKGRAFFTRTLLRSVATFPLVAKNEVVGILGVASYRPMEFNRVEVELLEGLAAQVAAAVTGIRMYRELAESQEELQRLNEQLQESMSIEHHLARTDVLTGIPNRRFIDETIEAECARARRYEQPLSVVMADLDDLKRINDTDGHAMGDETLRFAASVAQGSCREVDVVGRYGGDEFVFVLPATRVDDAAALAERFRRQLAEESSSRLGPAGRVTISLGVTEWNGDS